MNDPNVTRNTFQDVSEATQTLVDEIGLELLNVILGTKKGQITGWINGKGSPTDQQKKLILSLSDVVGILTAYIPIQEAKMWLVSHSDYLFGIPAKEVRLRPEEVRLAALNRVSRGEDYDLLRRMQ
jgi:hypothetical protein